jgi:hypothetical protein
MKKEQKLRRLKKLTGEVPYFYHRETIYNMALLINALVGYVNCLADKVEALEQQKKVGRYGD